MKGHVLDGTMIDVNQENYLAIKGEVSISHFTCIRHSFTTDLFLVLKKNPPFVKPLQWFVFDGQMKIKNNKKNNVVIKRKNTKTKVAINYQL